MTELTEQMVFDNFVGKPHEVIIKGIDGKEYTCKFEQFEAEDFASFLPFIKKYLNSLEKNDELSEELLKGASPWVEKMIDLSFPTWSGEGKKKFIKHNFIFLIFTMIETNMMQLMKNKDGLDKFIEKENKKIEQSKSVPAKG